jgi:DNA-binding transcriptional LysR family regulator
MSKLRNAADSFSARQSNLSRRVQSLEEELGIRLFERTNGGVRPTPAGREFLRGVRRILDELQAVVDGAKAISRGDAGYLGVGFYTSAETALVRVKPVAIMRSSSDCIEPHPTKESRT